MIKNRDLEDAIADLKETEVPIKKEPVLHHKISTWPKKLLWILIIIILIAAGITAAFYAYNNLEINLFQNLF